VGEAEASTEQASASTVAATQVGESIGEDEQGDVSAILGAGVSESEASGAAVSADIPTGAIGKIVIGGQAKAIMGIKLRVGGQWKSILGAQQKTVDGWKNVA
jgi:hypothetical protein